MENLMRIQSICNHIAPHVRKSSKSSQYSIASNFVSADINPNAQAVCTVHLHPRDTCFDRGSVIMERGSLIARAFRFKTGVAGLELKNELGSVILLPFQGQQIWDMEMLGRRLTMRSMFCEPRPVDPNKAWGYIDTYGAFFVHCGGNSVGIPGEKDDHALHGELPNAVYTNAQLVCGEDNRGVFIGLTGTYEHIVAFSANWSAYSEKRLYAGRSTISINMTITNHFHAPMDLMYMAHTNFVPVKDSQLKYSHLCGPSNVRVSASVNGLVPETPEYKAFVKKLTKNPKLHNNMTQHTLDNLNPEILMYLDHYITDNNGWAHSLQVHPDGTSDYVKHKPNQLPKVIRWMVVDKSHAALGLALPTTNDVKGRTAEKAKGQVRTLEPLCSYNFEVEVGALDQAATASISKKISNLLP